MTTCNVLFHHCWAHNVIPVRCTLPEGHVGAHGNYGDAALAETSWPGYPRKVPVGRGVVAQVALIEPAADEYQVLVQGPHTSITLDVVFIEDEEKRNEKAQPFKGAPTPYKETGGYVGVEEHALIEALDGALRIGALSVMLPADQALVRQPEVGLTILGLISKASDLTYQSPGQYGDQVRDLLARAMKALGASNVSGAEDGPMGRRQ